jgi:NAD(P)-dependent dehydrogenase (short-subunit alcohol dehydrogenase family)
LVAEKNMKTIQEMMSLSGRVAVITGGAGRLGNAFGETLAELGATVLLFDIVGDRATSCAAALHDRFGMPAFGYAVDITSEEQVNYCIRAVLEKHGRIDILVNNAAYAPAPLPADGFGLSDQSLAHWDAQTGVLVRSTFLMTKACVEPLRASLVGSVINIASIYGLVGPVPALYENTEMRNPAYYAAAKGGVVQLTRYFSTMLAPGIRVNCIAPGGIRTDQPAEFQERYNARTPLGRMATPEDVKGALAYLATDLSAYVTGQILGVDGGWTAW